MQTLQTVRDHISRSDFGFHVTWTGSIPSSSGSPASNADGKTRVAIISSRQREKLLREASGSNTAPDAKRVKGSHDVLTEPDVKTPAVRRVPFKDKVCQDF